MIAMLSTRYLGRSLEPGRNRGGLICSKRGGTCSKRGGTPNKTRHISYGILPADLCLDYSLAGPIATIIRYLIHFPCRSERRLARLEKLRTPYRLRLSAEISSTSFRISFEL